MKHFWSSSLLLAFAASTSSTELNVRNTVTVAPISIPPDENWDGIDGTWSSFTLRVGTPTQYVRTFLSFTGYQTWVVIPQGCPNAADSSCASSRGGIYTYNDSSTWDQLDIYDLSIDGNLGYTGDALYGYDTVGLAGAGENGPTLKNTTVGGIAGDSFYYGIFGINPKPTNFTSFNEESPSYMTQLRDQHLIPSLSFAYTAGAHYRFAGTYASLTLGGYDTSKYNANNITFNFGSDNDHEIIVGLQSVTTANKDTSNTTPVKLLPSAIYIEIDTTIAQLWLPIEACKVFESEFGLIWNDTAQLYLLNDTQRQSLLSRNPNITFTFGQTLTGGSTLQVILPYAAFDQQVQPPYPNIQNTSYYFPLRRAANNTQYVLGRTFMQEAYIIVDYEVSRFQLAQTVWNQYASTNLVAIGAANSSTDSSLWTSSAYKPGSTVQPTTGSVNSGISVGAIVGIVVAIVAILLLGVLAFFLIRRHKRRTQATEMTSKGDAYYDDKPVNVFPKAELAGSEPGPFGLTHHDADRKALLTPYPPSSAGTAAHSLGSSGWSEGTMSTQHGPLIPLSEAHSRTIYEMPGDMPNREKDGRQLSEKEALQHRERVYNGIDEALEQSSSSTSQEQSRERKRILPDEVVNAETGDALGRHRAFSFEFDPDEVQHLTENSDRTLAHSDPSAAGSSTVGLADGGEWSPATSIAPHTPRTPHSPHTQQHGNYI